MTEIEPCPKCGALPCDWTDNPHTAPSGDEKEDEAVDDWNQRAERPSPAASEVERAVMVCPQCEGEGGYPDGMDEAACHTECTRCGSNGWIVDRTALYALFPSVSKERCEYCDGTGDVHRADGEWLGSCDCTQAAIAAMRPARGVELAETGAVIRLTPRLLLDRMLPSGAGLDDAPDSKIVAMYLSLGELRGLRGLIAALRQAGEG